MTSIPGPPVNVNKRPGRLKMPTAVSFAGKKHTKRQL
jgi:hypothetical protein